MNPEPSMRPERDERLGEILAEWIEAAERGQSPDSAEWLSHHAEFASELEQFLANRARLQEAAEPLCQVMRAVVAVVPSSGETPHPLSQESTGIVPAAEMIGRSVGEHDLLEEIGQGGMGLVYRARHRRLQRLVALKMLRANVLPAAADVQRFRNEAEVLAQLDHPHIIPVHDIGEHEGRVYFSMKLIEGGGLDGQLDRFRDDPAGAARLVGQVARAVHHAHQRGILHRDLKPSNILLDQDGQPHVSDFGLAKRVETDANLTQTGAIVGTPSYMAPEQTSGRKGAVTTATDVYGLGAVLYALLTGRPPFQGETVLETLDQVREREPQSPRRINAKVDRDLETICLKCLQKEPQRRYESAQALAEDLERWRKREPIRARRAGQWERFRRWVWRQPTLAALVFVTVLALVGFVAGLLWHNDQLQRAAEREKTAAERERQKRQLAHQAVDKMYTQVARKWLKEEPLLTNLQREFLEEALHFYQDLSQEEATEPEIRRDTALAHRYMGEILAKLERRPEAEQAYNQAIAHFDRLAAEYPDEPDYAHNLAKTYSSLGLLQHRGGHGREAEMTHRRGVEINEKLVQKYPRRTDYRETLGMLYMNLSHLLPLLEMEKMLQQARIIYEHLLAGSPDSDELHTTLGGILNNLAMGWLQQGEPAQARPLLEQAIAHQQAALKVNPRSKGALQFLRNHYSILAEGVLRPQGENEQALKAAQEGLATAQRLVREFPQIPSYEEMVADSQNDLGWILRDLGRLGEAEDALRQARTLREKAVARNLREPNRQALLAETCNKLGSLLVSTGREGEAADQFRRALELDPQSPNTKVNLAWSLAAPETVSRQDAAEAVDLARQAVQQAPEVWHCWNALGAALYRTGDWKQAQQSLEKAKVLRKGFFPPTYLFLAMTRWRLGNKDEARRLYREVVQWWKDKDEKQVHEEWRRLRAECASLLGIPEQHGKNKETATKKK